MNMYIVQIFDKIHLYLWVEYFILNINCQVPHDII